MTDYQIDIRHSSGFAIGDGATVHNNYHLAPPAPIDSETVTAARERLAQLPLHHIPDVATLPAGSRFPYRANPNFVGRKAQLRDLARRLQQAGGVVAVTGLGGMGKSQLAAAFAHRYGQFFAGGVYWLSFADPASIPSEVAACAPPGHEGLALETQIKQVLSDWQSDLPRLLIFDNCEDETLLTHWLPPTGAGRVLVTSRQQWHTVGVQSLPLPTLHRVESVTLLQKYRPDLALCGAGGESEGALEAIAAELGDLPLALHLAGGYLETCRHDPLFGRPADFLAELRSKRWLNHPALQGEDVSPSPTHHHLHVGRTFALSYDHLDPAEPIDQTALALLNRAACFAPGEPIPRDLLLATLAPPDDDREAARRAARALRRLTHLGLLAYDVEGADVVLHRLLVRFVQQLAADEAALAAVEGVVLVEVNRLNDDRLPAVLMSRQAHLHYLANAAQGREDDLAVDLSKAYGDYLNMIGDYRAAKTYYEHALAIRKKCLGSDHLHTAQIEYNLGIVLSNLGRYDRAEHYYNHALTVTEAALGPDHPDTAACLNSLGFLMIRTGEHTTAKTYLERGLAIYKQTYGLAHRHTMTTLNNLGGLLVTMEDYQSARSHLNTVLAVREEILGPDHFNTAQTVYSLGTLYFRTGDYDAAKTHYDRVLTIYEKTFGAQHPDIATILNNLGFLYYTMGNYAAARPYYVRALAISEKMLGVEHPQIALSLNNLGALCYQEGDFQAAVNYLARVVIIWETALGAEHPSTKTARQNLEIIRQKL